MLNDKDPKNRLFTNGLELLLLFTIFIMIFFQLLLGNENPYSHMLRIVSIAGMSFYAGYYSSLKSGHAFDILKKGGFYILLYLLLGLINQVLIYKNNLLKSIAWMLTLEKIPEPSEIFFTISVIFICSAMLSKYIPKMLPHKLEIVFFSICSLGIVFMPETLFDYPIIGVFLGCDSYNCTPILPFVSFWFAGIFAHRNELHFKLKHVLLTGGLSTISAVLCATSFKPLASITFMALPVYLIYVFSKHCSIYQKLAFLPWKILEFLDIKLHHFFFDTNGKLKKNPSVYLTIYTFCFTLIILIIFSPFWIDERTLVWKRDALSQYVPRAYYFADYIRNLFSQFLEGNFTIPTYDFRIGFGGPVSFSSEPLYLLFALFPASRVELAYNVILILRLYLAGLSMSALLAYFKKENYEILFGSLMYTFCEFALYSSVVHAHFISPMILLPLLIIATEEIFQKKRWYLCTIVTALALLSSYYFIYMSTLAIGIYYIARFVFTKNKEKKTLKYFLTTTCTFAFSYLLGVVIGNLPLFTSFSSYLGSGRTGDSPLTTPSFFSYGYNWITKFLVSFITVPSGTNYWLKLGFIPLAYIAVIVLFLKNEKKILKFLFILYTAFCIFPIAGYIFGGFSVVTNRWCYIYALLVTFITVCALPKLQELTNRELIIIIISMIPYALITLITKNYQTSTLPPAFIMLLFSFIFVVLINNNIHFIKKEFVPRAFIILCIVSICINGFALYTEGKFTTPSNFSKKNEVLSTIENTPLCAIQTIEDDSFYRATTTRISNNNINSSLVLDYNGITVFSSTVNGLVADYNAILGNSTWSMILYQGFDNRTFLNTMANVKYYAIKKEDSAYLPYGYKFLKDETIYGTTYSLYENEYALPFGYTYSNVISEDELDSYSATNKQELLLQAATVSTEDSALKTTADQLLTTAKNVEIKKYDANGIEFTKSGMKVLEPDATLTLYFDSIPNTETYLEYTGTYEPETSPHSNVVRIKIDSSDNTSRSYTMRSNKHTYATNQDSYVFNLGYHEDTLSSCTITFNATGTFDYDSFKIYGQSMDSYESYIDNLTEDILENVEMTANSVKGTISLDEDKLLVLGIPYQKGWTAYVDGKETCLEKANIMYTGIHLESGDHTIELYYERPGLNLSIILSISGICIFIVALIIRHLRIKIKRGKKLQENHYDKI